VSGEDSFVLPEVTRFNPDDHRSYLQLVGFYNYVKNREYLIEEWRENSKRVVAIIRNTSPCSVCKYNTKANGHGQGCDRCGCGFAYLWFFSVKGLEAYRRESRLRSDEPKSIHLLKMMARFEKSNIEQIKAIERLEAVWRLVDDELPQTPVTLSFRKRFYEVSGLEPPEWLRNEVEVENGGDGE